MSETEYLDLKAENDSLKQDLENMKFLYQEKLNQLTMQQEARMKLLQSNSDIVRTFDEFVRWTVDSSIFEEDESEGIEIISSLIESGVLTDPFMKHLEFSVDVRMRMSDTITVRVPNGVSPYDVRRVLAEAIEYGLTNDGYFNEDMIIVNGTECPIGHMSILHTENAHTEVEIEEID